jgi:hypothetical protein
MLGIEHLKANGVEKSFDRLGKGNPMLSDIGGFLERIPFKLHDL